MNQVEKSIKFKSGQALILRVKGPNVDDYETKLILYRISRKKELNQKLTKDEKRTLFEFIDSCTPKLYLQNGVGEIELKIDPSEVFTATAILPQMFNDIQSFSHGLHDLLSLYGTMKDVSREDMRIINETLT